jgi:hypothetical protein
MATKIYGRKGDVRLAYPTTKTSNTGRPTGISGGHAKSKSTH